MSFQPSLGAWPNAGGVRFRVWAPAVREVRVVLDSADGEQHVLAPEAAGYHSALLAHAAPGARYRYLLDGQGPFPDPASRFQPQGVHGPSQVVDPAAFSWTDGQWRGLSLDDAVIYELHVGTFTPEGTFAAASDRLPDLARLGVTAVELMPAADFPGSRNWGYDGVCLFAPARRYGIPDELRRLVDHAHRLGLAVLLDVVYNHLGPDGAYASAFCPFYFTDRHQSPWGAGVNLDGEHSGDVRAFFIENAMHWLHEYHADGLRLDATHALVDDSPRHLLAELSERVRASIAPRQALLIAEDDRNLAQIIHRADAGGWGMDAVWADDFHHQMRRLLAGDAEGYFMDFSGSAGDLAATLGNGWFFCGQHSEFRQAPRGTEPGDEPLNRFVVCLQNHDQVGNRAMGDRLHHVIDAASYRAASAVLLCAPETPLLFMGQEWAVGSPFQYFTDHHEALGRLVTEGRRREFRHFSAFTDESARLRIPDPQAASTVDASRLQWDERRRPAHAAVLRLYEALLRLRREEPSLRNGRREDFRTEAVGKSVVWMLRRRDGSRGIAVAACLKGAAEVSLPAAVPEGFSRGDDAWDVLLTTEDPGYCDDPQPVSVSWAGGALQLRFSRPGAVILGEA